MSHIPPNCDAACRAKIILNGGRVRSEIESAMEFAVHLNLTKAEAFQLIAILDEAEDKLIEWNNRRLNSTGYKRETNNAFLDEKHKEKGNTIAGRP